MPTPSKVVGTSLYSSLWGYWLAVAGDIAPGVAPRARLRLTMHSSHEIVGCPRFCPPRSRAGTVALPVLVTSALGTFRSGWSPSFPWPRRFSAPLAPSPVGSGREAVGRFSPVEIVVEIVVSPTVSSGASRWFGHRMASTFTLRLTRSIAAGPEWFSRRGATPRISVVR